LPGSLTYITGKALLQLSLLMVPKYDLGSTHLLMSQVIINGRRDDVIQATANEINAAVKSTCSGGEVVAIQADVATKEGVVHFFDKCSKIIDKVLNYKE
jgi:hypothetical protein